MITKDLIKATPELSPQKRAAYFGARSIDEQKQLIDLFKRCTKEQRAKIYAQLSQWLNESQGASN